MERLSSFVLFVSVFICLTVSLSESLTQRKVSDTGRVHNFDRERRSLDYLRSTGRIKREVENDHCKKSNDVISRLKADVNLQKSFVHEVHLVDDSKGNLQLAWTGEDYEKVLIVTSDNGAASLYTSNDNLLTYQNRTSELVGSSISGKEVIVVKHPNASKIVYIVAGVGLDYTMFVTLDGAVTFKQASVSFVISALTFHPTKPNLVLAADNTKKDLYLSRDSGMSWEKVKSRVFDVKWSTYGGGSDDIYVLTTNDTNPLFGILLSSDIGLLQKSEDFGRTWVTVMTDVHSFGMEGKFLYCSKYISLTSRVERNLMVSTDNGTHWNRARLPTITPDRFYSIVDSSEGQIILHVDNPGDTGHGTLYISDATGIVFSEALQRHLYPNYEDITDFYKVQSMRGVYITSVIGEDNSIHTVITYNGGAEWRPIVRPIGRPRGSPTEYTSCNDESKVCSLQIHNLYSIKRDVKASPPLSVPNAAGIILVHGHVADSIQSTNPDVFVSSDGGYTWRFALEGPHHYQIADHGGFLVAVPADTDTPNTVKFSTDAGHCWGSYEFTNETNVVFTGLVIEPGNRVMTVAIWGYTAADRVWHTFVLNFTSIISDACKESDYEPWTEHDPHANSSGCVLGSKQTIKRIKDDSWCYNGRAYAEVAEELTCSCTKEDYYCDFGYKRRSADDACEKDPTISESDLNICFRGHEQRRVFVGYHKIPGNKCTGGYEPPHNQLIDLKQKCTVDYVKSLQDPKAKDSSMSHSVVTGLLIIAVAIALIIATTYIAKKYKVYRQTKVTYRYSSIRCEDADDDEGALEALRRNSSLYDNSSDDSDTETTNIVSKASNTNVKKGKTAATGSTVSNGQLPNGHSSSNGGHINVQISSTLPPAAPVTLGKTNGGSSKPGNPGTAPPSSSSGVPTPPRFNRGPLDDTDDELLH